MFHRPLLFALIGLAIVSRLVPHPPNFVFLGALGLFAGCHFRGLTAWLAPLLALGISDLVGHFAGVRGMGFYNPALMFSVYVGVAISALLGTTLRARQSFPRVASAAIACSAAFFLVSNFGVWLTGSYASGLPGLVACYSAAIPFFQNTLAGDAFYSVVTFGSMAAWQAWRSAGFVTSRDRVTA